MKRKPGVGVPNFLFLFWVTHSVAALFCPSQFELSLSGSPKFSILLLFSKPPGCDQGTNPFLPPSFASIFFYVDLCCKSHSYLKPLFLLLFFFISSVRWFLVETHEEENPQDCHGTAPEPWRMPTRCPPCVGGIVEQRTTDHFGEREAWPEPQDGTDFGGP